MEREINKKLRNMKKSQLDKVCGKMKCPMGTKKEMIIRLLRPLRKYKMGNDERVPSLQKFSHDVIFPDFQKHMMDAENNYPPGVIDILLEGYKERCFHAKNETLRGAVKEYIENKRSAIRKYGDISKWDVSNVTNMEEMFIYSDFNEDISKWDVSNVTDMNNMFYNAKNFNGDLSKWDVSNVKNMYAMFYSASSFNRNLSKWDVSKVTNMSKMFEYAESFNGDLSKWNVSNVRDMSYMFKYAESFNGDLSAWNVSKVTDIGRMFKYAESFNGDLSGWDVSNVTNMYEIFEYAESFDRRNAPWY